MSNQLKVPSVYSYSKPKNREAQWGSDISDDAITMVNMKLELQPQDLRLAELESALNVLRGTGDLSFDNLRKVGSNPAYPTKTPAQIIADYHQDLRVRVPGHRPAELDSHQDAR